MIPLVAAIPYRPPATPIPVVLLHPAAAAEAAATLARLWSPIVPAAMLVTLPVCPAIETDAVPASLIPQRGRGTLTDNAGVLAGVCGAEVAALRLAFAPEGPIWTGVLVCGRALPPLTPLTGTLRRTRLRLVWDEIDPLPYTAALAELLRCYRAAGVDAQGSVTARRDSPDDGLSPAFVRLGGAYLSELVAIALRSEQPRGRPPPAAAASRENGATS